MISTEGDIITGLIGALLFLFKNPDKNYKTLIFVFVVGLFASQTAFIYLHNSLPGQIIWTISTAGLLIFYPLRLKNKPNKRTIDFLKPIGLVFLIIYPIPFFSLVPVGQSDFWAVTNIMTFFVLGTIYIYDRLILKPETMKRKFIISLVIQTILIGMFFIYAFIQKREADRQRELADEQMRKSEQLYSELNKEIENLKDEIKNCR
ncbi:MAG: hypothetical protein ACOYXT_05580 [Bacteroidota bacterium]